MQRIREGLPPDPFAMPTFPELQSLLGFPEYFAEAAAYAHEPTLSEYSSFDSASGVSSSDTSSSSDSAAAASDSEVRAGWLPVATRALSFEESDPGPGDGNSAAAVADADAAVRAGDRGGVPDAAGAAPEVVAGGDAGARGDENDSSGGAANGNEADAVEPGMAGVAEARASELTEAASGVATGGWGVQDVRVMATAEGRSTSESSASDSDADALPAAASGFGCAGDAAQWEPSSIGSSEGGMRSMEAGGLTSTSVHEAAPARAARAAEGMPAAEACGEGVGADDEARRQSEDAGAVPDSGAGAGTDAPSAGGSGGAGGAGARVVSEVEPEKGARALHRQDATVGRAERAARGAAEAARDDTTAAQPETEPLPAQDNAGKVTTAVLVRPWDQQPQEEPRLDLSQLSVRVVVTNVASGKVSFETRLPAGFLEPVTAAVPRLVRVAALRLCAAARLRVCAAK
jgi:hypothetical protein